jgi:hypothetical protein
MQLIAPATLMKVQQMQLEKAVEFVKRIGFDEDLDRSPIKVVTWLGPIEAGIALLWRTAVRS